MWTGLGDTISKLYKLEKSKNNFLKARTLKIVAYDHSGFQIATFDISKNIKDVKRLIVSEIDKEINTLKNLRGDVNETKLG